MRSVAVAASSVYRINATAAVATGFYSFLIGSVLFFYDLRSVLLLLLLLQA